MHLNSCIKTKDIQKFKTRLIVMTKESITMARKSSYTWKEGAENKTKGEEEKTEEAYNKVNTSQIRLQVWLAII